MSWLAMALTVAAVWQYSQGGDVFNGNCLQLLSALLWILVGINAEMLALVVLNLILAGRAARMIHKGAFDL